MPLTIHFLNVGRGDCTIIEFPSGRVGVVDIDNLKSLDPKSEREYIEEYQKSFEYQSARQQNPYGALRLEPEEIRHRGAGQLLGCVLEAEAVESLALSGGFLGLVAGIETAIAAAVLGMSAGGLLHVDFS